MEIRPISANEEIAASKIQSIAFAFNSDFEASQEPKEKKDESYKTCRAVFDENGKMCSCLELLPFEAMFNGKVVHLSGIGGVATLPEEIGKRYAQQLMAYCMEEMYEKGDIFSYLYPFSHVYYRKFGYELNMKVNNYTIPIEAFKIFKDRKNLKLYLPKEDTQDIKRIYNEFIKDKNLALVRNDDRWNIFFDKDPYKDNVYIYVLYNSENQPVGYIKYSVNKKAFDNKEMVINELIWLNFEALSGIFSFISGHAPQYRNVKWRAPEFIDLKLLFPEPYAIECQELTHGMNRIVNVKKCLELLEVPEHLGDIVIEVVDDFFSKNSGKYCVAWRNCSLEVTKSQSDADLICDIQSLSQLVTGFSTPKRLYRLNKVKLSGDALAVERLFTKKDLFINDGF